LTLKTYFVGFGSIFNHPLLAWAVRFHRLIPIDANINLAEALRVCQYVLKQGKILVYFPEGQRSADGTIKEFRKGIGILLKESKAKTMPIYLNGAYNVWPRTRKIPIPARVEVKIGNTLELKELCFSSKEEYSRVAENLRKKTLGLTGKHTP
jgi:long-chain acyl-CoA synthetase